MWEGIWIRVQISMSIGISRHRLSSSCSASLLQCLLLCCVMCLRTVFKKSNNSCRSGMFRCWKSWAHQRTLRFPVFNRKALARGVAAAGAYLVLSEAVLTLTVLMSRQSSAVSLAFGVSLTYSTPDGADKFHDRVGCSVPLGPGASAMSFTIAWASSPKHVSAHEHRRLRHRLHRWGSCLGTGCGNDSGSLCCAAHLCRLGAA